ncbi:beta-galactosidase [bacterium A37T11]|nr:beta-galactosidase [bacterium A37T11]
MKIRLFIFCVFLFISIFSVVAQERQSVDLNDNWKFTKGDVAGAAQPDFDDRKWQKVSVPHDWAIYGPFDKGNDLQVVQIVQNGEKVPSEKTGRTGALPYMGTAWYRRQLDIPNFVVGKRVVLLFDGAMSHARVYVNGKEAGYWAYGYNAFHLDVTPFLKKDGPNVLAVRLDNPEESSRWYPGAGIFRHVHLIITNEPHIPVWGTYVSTPSVRDGLALVRLRTQVDGVTKQQVGQLVTKIYDPQGKMVTTDTTSFLNDNYLADQYFRVHQPQLWSPEKPLLYKAVSQLYVDGRLEDFYETTFGIRWLTMDARNGLMLNGKFRKFHGVCDHHDLGPLGAAVNKAALKRKLMLLKDVGVDAIRTSHNMPSPELISLCDELGFMVIAESFDEWKAPKIKNGYSQLFDQWAEKDLVNLIHAFRNHPSVVMWSIGNEVPDQHTKEGVTIASWLQDICHREDPTRLVTSGMDQIDAALNNGFAAILDVPGFNYKPSRYKEALQKLPQGFLYGSETASTVSSRGSYSFPVKEGADVIHTDKQCSSYDLEHCAWSQTPDEEFVQQDDLKGVLGEFVWTGVDYLGEPSPYDGYWPSHSSYFGMIDLAGIPKDRYYLYRSRWNKSSPTLHLVPHWTWPGREGKITPVYCYTNYPAAELFVNGKSMGVKRKNPKGMQTRYRLMWDSVRYEPGSVRVVALDINGLPVAEEMVKTAGKPHHILMNADRYTLAPDQQDLSFITVRVVDKDGNLCPQADNELAFEVSGAASFRAAANGDPTSLEMFHLPHMKVFNGQLVVILQAGRKQGDAELKISGKKLKSGKLILHVIR